MSLMRSALLIGLLFATASPSVGVSRQTPTAPAAASLDYEYFKTRVQPIFLKKRAGHARCISCHGGGDFYHSGGKHWNSQNDAEWQTLKGWVLGQTAK